MPFFKDKNYILPSFHINVINCAAFVEGKICLGKIIGISSFMVE